DAQREVGEPQRVSAAVGGDALSRRAVGGELALETLDLRAADELRAAQRAPERFDQPLFQRAMGGDEIQKRHRRVGFGRGPGIGHRYVGSFTKRSSLAGLPTTIEPSATSAVTTAPAPTMAPAPMVMPGRITAPLPIAARRLTSVRSSRQSAGPLGVPSSFTAAGQRSFKKLTLCP